MKKIFVRDNKRMIEIGDLAKEVAIQKKISDKHAFSFVFNEASAGLSFVEDIIDGKPVYQLATQKDLLERLLEEKDRTDGKKL